MQPETVRKSFRPVEFEVTAEGDGFLVGSRCGNCGAHFFPVRAACAGCLHDSLETVRFSRAATLYTFSVVRQSTPEFEVPYALGYVDLPEGVRIMTQLTGRDPEDYELGMEMELVVEPFGEDEDGTELVGFRFRPKEVSG
ncbi:MAG: Zn-ribbon domain-containing OB-fold protein [Acidimicrobiia bacterium]